MGHRPVPKSPDRRQGHHPVRTLALAPTMPTPSAPKGLLKEVREQWAVYWASDVARAAQPTHLPIVKRLFTRYDERERAYRTVRKEGRLTEGSTGQPVKHPLLKYIDDCDAEIRQLEDRLGLSPRSMAQLGANFAQAQKSLDDLNRTLESDDDDRTDDADPRLEVAG